MMKKLKPKTQKKVLWGLRSLSQLMFFIFLPSAFTSAFGGVKYIFGQMNLKDTVELTGFVVILISLCGFTMVFGRFFCGFACAFGTLGDFLHGIYLRVCRKFKKKPFKLNKTLGKIFSCFKYLMLAVVCSGCFFGIYGKITGWSPWDVFSMLRAGNFKFSGFALGISLLVVIALGMIFIERFFCRFLCPLGAVFSFLPILPIFTLRRSRENCITGCKACSTVCPADIELPDKGGYGGCGNCFQCGKCVGTCPKKNISTSIKAIKGNEILFTLVRCGILAVLLVWAGV